MGWLGREIVATRRDRTIAACLAVVCLGKFPGQTRVIRMNAAGACIRARSGPNSQETG
jgi:hypothetical protein